MSYERNNEKINKRAFYKEKVALFKDYASRYPEKDLLELYNEWIAENDIYGIERHKIWKRARKLRKLEPIIIKEGSEEWIRLQAVLDILLEADLARLNKLIEKRKQKASKELGKFKN